MDTTKHTHTDLNLSTVQVYLTLLSQCKIHVFNPSVTLVLLIATELFIPLLSSEPSAKKVRQTDLRVLAADGAFGFEV